MRSEALLMASHLGLALLAVDNLGWNNLGGRGLGTRAHAFGLGDNHLGDGSRGCDDGWFGPLNCLQALLTLRRNKEHEVMWKIMGGILSNHLQMCTYLL